MSRLNGKKIGILGVKPNQKDLNVLLDLVETGKAVPVINPSRKFIE